MDLWPKYMNNKIIFKSSFLLLQIPTDRHQCMKLWFHLWYLKEQSHSENIKLLLLFVVVASTDALHAGLWPCGPLRTPRPHSDSVPPAEWRWRSRSSLTSHRRSGVDRRMVQQIEAAACWAHTHRKWAEQCRHFFTLMPPRGDTPGARRTEPKSSGKSFTPVPPSSCTNSPSGLVSMCAEASTAQITIIFTFLQLPPCCLQDCSLSLRVYFHSLSACSDLLVKHLTTSRLRKLCPVRKYAAGVCFVLVILWDS